MDKLKISGHMLASAKKAEESLARAEAKRIGNDLPEGHPLKAEVERQKALLGGDLSGLPPGHPLMRELESARKAHEDKQIAAKETEQDAPNAGVKKAKKLDVDRIRREARLREDDETDRRRAAAGNVNKGIDAVMRDVKELFQMVAANEELLVSDPMNRTRCARLRRILFATERGVGECRIARF